MPRCSGTTLKGKQCCRIIGGQEEYCYLHKPKTTTPTPVNDDPVNAVITDEIKEVNLKMKILLEDLAKCKKEHKMLQKIKKTQMTKIIVKAQWLYYHDTKMREEITTKLIQAGLAKPMYRKKTIHIPYTIVKQYTDVVFAKLDKSTYDSYMNTAREIILGA